MRYRGGNQRPAIFSERLQRFEASGVSSTFVWSQTVLLGVIETEALLIKLLLIKNLDMAQEPARRNKLLALSKREILDEARWHIQEKPVGQAPCAVPCALTSTDMPRGCPLTSNLCNETHLLMQRDASHVLP